METSKYKLKKEIVLYRLVNTKMMEEVDYCHVPIGGLARIKSFDNEEEALEHIIDSCDSYISYVILPTYRKVHDYD